MIVLSWAMLAYVSIVGTIIVWQWREHDFAEGLSPLSWVIGLTVVGNLAAGAFLVVRYGWLGLGLWVSGTALGIGLVRLRKARSK